ncbi:unnamed protein product [Sphagnum troendelagicum]|uniref:Uncharacterized protein n=1 Tax=Sphagnum troendelagicum TaxID=128251 RepID=A0ABP0V4D1_9BRYO
MSIRVMKLVLFALVLLSSAVSSYCYYVICYEDELLCVQYPIVNSTNKISIVVGLILDDASIVGTLPPEIGDLQNLAILDLSGNQLTGDIPNLGGLTWLQTLKLMNKFDGLIDLASIFNPSSTLNVLDLSWNNFSGPLPSINFLVVSSLCLNSQLGI